MSCGIGMLVGLVQDRVQWRALLLVILNLRILPPDFVRFEVFRPMKGTVWIVSYCNVTERHSGMVGTPVTYAGGMVPLSILQKNTAIIP